MSTRGGKVPWFPAAWSKPCPFAPTKVPSHALVERMFPSLRSFETQDPVPCFVVTDAAIVLLVWVQLGLALRLVDTVPVVGAVCGT
jgi:hypothetical protein